MIKAPFPYFGGKRRVADVVWRAFGPDVNNYVEPFAGSLAVLLARPGGPGKIETINDVNRHVANFWRAVQADPSAVARHADWPVNEADLHARHRWLVEQLHPDADFTRRMHADPDHFDAKIAGWWVWGICQWIGGGWCSDTSARRPDMSSARRGIHSPRLAEKLPHLSNAGRGVHRMPEHLPKLGVVDGCSSIGGIHGVAAPPADQWFRALQERLRRVRVACGDWRRVLSSSVLGKGLNVGGRRPCAVFLDPPYAGDLRAKKIYASDSGTVSADVRAWAIEHGDDPDLRIALCGYAGEHELPDSWTEWAWRGARGYARATNANRERERVWFSPHCLPIGERGLFGRNA